MLICNLLLILVYLALYESLKGINKSVMIISVIFGIIGIVLLLVSREATFSMLTLSNQYSLVTTENEKQMLISIGQTMLTIYNGGVFNISYVMGAIPLLLIPFVMVKSNIFKRSTAIIMGISGLLMTIPPTVGMIGLLFSLISLIPTIIWLVIVALKLFQLGKISNEKKFYYKTSVATENDDIKK